MQLNCCHNQVTSVTTLLKCDREFANDDIHLPVIAFITICQGDLLSTGYRLQVFGSGGTYFRSFAPSFSCRRRRRQRASSQSR